MDVDSILGAIFSFDNYGELLVLVQNSIWAGAILGLLGGLVGTFVMKRDLAFAVHGISELSFAGAAFALLVGTDVVFGSLVGSVAAALLLGLMGVRARDKNSIIGVIMPFGLGLGILFLSLYQGRAANKFGLLTGQIVSAKAGGVSAVPSSSRRLPAPPSRSSPSCWPSGARSTSPAWIPRWPRPAGFPCVPLPSSSWSCWASAWHCPSRWWAHCWCLPC